MFLLNLNWKKKYTLFFCLLNLFFLYSLGSGLVLALNVWVGSQSWCSLVRTCVLDYNTIWHNVGCGKNCNQLQLKCLVLCFLKQFLKLKINLNWFYLKNHSLRVIFYWFIWPSLSFFLQMLRCQVEDGNKRADGQQHDLNTCHQK